MPTVTLRPNADGDLLDFAIYPSTPATHFDKVDEETSDGDSTYVFYEDSTEQLTRRDLYNLPDGIIPNGSTINSVTVYVVVRNVVSGVGTYATTIKTGGVVYDGTLNAPTGTAWRTYSTVYSTNPNTGVAWTISEIDALQIGIKMQGEYYPPAEVYLSGRCTQVYVVIDYTPPPTVVETIVAQDYPRLYLESPIKAQQLTSKVSGATIIKTSNDYPMEMLKKNKANELRSKWTQT